MMQRLARMANALSLDVAAGAWLCGRLGFWWLGEEPPWAWELALPLATWLAYLGDHLLDARRLPAERLAARRRLHLRWQRPLAAAWLLGLAGGIALLPHMPPALLRFGLGMALACGLYLAAAQGRAMGDWKEASVALLYGLAVWGGAWSLHPAQAGLAYGLAALQFELFSFSNLLIFSALERNEDLREGQGSFAAARSERQALRWAAGAAALSALPGLALLGLEGFSSQALILEGILLLMGLVHLLMAGFPDVFHRQEGYRLLGDGIFLLPGTIVLFS
jgi:hypothetical protein